MAGKIPSEFILNLIERVDIVDLIDARVPLKKAGVNYTARCPFHNEKTPSFSVNREKQFYHCFGCGAHGNAISFLMEFERQSFPEAVESLAEHLGLSVPGASEDDSRDVNRALLARLYEIQTQVARFYAGQFKAHPEGVRAASYLKSRGVSGEIAKEFMLGFSPPGWRNLPESFSSDELDACGLIVRKDRTFYDRFRDRIMFPIRDQRGRVVGFGGRVMGGESPKYLNSPETHVFKKHKELYGLFELLQTTKRPERILVVEGYMDVVTLAEGGIRYAVATLGTSTSEEHVALLFRYTNEVVFCFDGDLAGRAAAWKALAVTFLRLRDGKRTKFLILPEKEDPDSLVRSEGSQRFAELVAGSLPCSEYFFQELLKGRDLSSIEDRAALHGQAVPLLEKIPKGPFKGMMFERLNELLGRSAVRREKSTKLVRTAVAKGPQRTQPSTLRTVVVLLLNFPEFNRLVDEECRDYLLRDKRIGMLMHQVMSLLDQSPGLTSGALIEHFRGTDVEAQIKSISLGDVVAPESGVEHEFIGALARLKANARSSRINKLLKIAGAGSLASEEREELTKLLRQKSQ